MSINTPREKLNGGAVIQNLIDHLENGNKVDAIKALRQIDICVYEYADGKTAANIGLLDCKLFVEGLEQYIKQNAGHEKPDYLKIELENYKRLRDAGYSLGEAIKILQILS